MDKKIFVGSSKEAESYCNNVVEIIEQEENLESVSWQNSFSANNESHLDSLIRNSYLVDFAIFIATKDDITKSRDEEKESPRDNVLFEFGLFLSSLGKDRCFLVVEEGCKILSDMNGITLTFFDENNFKDKIATLIDNINEKKKNIPSLVTTGLAFGYYKNFLSKLKFNEIEIETVTLILRKKDFDRNDYKSSKNTPSINFGVREAFYLEDGNKKNIFDYPTTLDVIEDIINEKKELNENDKDSYRERELENFENIIKQLAENENFSKKIKF